MFIIGVGELLLLPIVFLVLSTLLKYLIPFLMKRNKKRVKKLKQNVSSSKATRDDLKQQIISTDDEELQAKLKDKLNKLSNKELFQRVSLTFANITTHSLRFLLWVSRLVSWAMLALGSTLLIASFGLGVAILVVATMMSNACSGTSKNASGLFNQVADNINHPSQLLTTFSDSYYLATGYLSENIFINSKDYVYADSVKKSDDFGQEYDKDREAVQKWGKDFEFTFIGDSLGVGVEDKLKATFPKSNFDSKVSRAVQNPTDASLSGVDVLKDLKAKNQVKDTLVIALGTNDGDLPTSKMDAIYKEIPDNVKRVVWITSASHGFAGNPLNHDGMANQVKDYANSKDNMVYLDFNKLVNSKNNWDSITVDGVHMNDEGNKLYEQFISKGLYDAFSGESSSSSDDKDSDKDDSKSDEKKSDNKCSTSKKSSKSSSDDKPKEDGKVTPVGELPTSAEERAKLIIPMVRKYEPNATDEGISAMLGNFWHESEINPKRAENDTGPGNVGASEKSWDDENWLNIGEPELYGGRFPNIKHRGLGLGQWSDTNDGGNRSTLLREFAKKKNKKWYDLELQIEFMFTEDTGKDTLRGIITAKGDVNTLTTRFLQEWEVTSLDSLSQRQAHANQVMEIAKTVK